MSDKQGIYQDRIGQGSFGRNQMLWDFGLEPEYFDNDTAIQSKIDEIESTFDLVLLTEEFDASMVLLKDLLCWDYADMTSLKLNAQKSSSKSKLSAMGREKLSSWMAADYKLYNHFQDKFQQEIENYGGQLKLKHELEILKHANQEVEQDCVIKQVDNTELAPEDRLHGHGVMSYQINQEKNTCSFMAMKEVKFLNILRQIQTSRAEEMSGMNFQQNAIDPEQFQTLGSHVSLDKLKTMFKFKGPI